MRFAALAIALCAACGEVQFVEPAPPRLRTAEASWTASQSADPLVFITLLDLYLEPPLDCAAARQWTKDAVARAMASTGAPWTLELPSQDLSPACDQPAKRAVDVSAATQQLLAAIAAHPEANVRGVVVYVNNIDLPLGDGLRAGVLGLRAQMAIHRQLDPLTWFIGAPAARDSLSPDLAVRWSYAGDTALEAALQSTATHELPLMTDGEIDSGPLPLVPEGDPAQSVKVCSRTSGIVFDADDGVAVTVNAEQRPLFAARFTRRVAQRRSHMQPLTATVNVELCDEHCDRYFDYRPGVHAERWLQSRSCALEAP